MTTNPRRAQKHLERTSAHKKSTRRRSVEERAELGKALREGVPRKSHAVWRPGTERRDPTTLLEEQNKNRLDWLVPVRRARMMASPFAFYRGGARIMAADLSTTPVTGLTVQACGDAHLANFGAFASPERELVFDLNDFDETLEGPWEWDVKRLAASFTIAGRDNGLDGDVRRKVTRRVVRSYREAMKDFAGWRTMDIWYGLLKTEDIVAWVDSRRGEKRMSKASAKAKTKHSLQALDRLAEEVDGQYRIKSEPPLLLPLRDLNQKQDGVDEESIRQTYETYVRSLSPDLKMLLNHFRPVDMGVKVVGVGSVGTRCWILLLEGRDRSDPLFIQMKEATESVLAEFLRPSPYENQARRVAEGQRVMQAANDIFLGWTRNPETGHEFYGRQLRDWKGSADIASMRAGDLNRYARLCGWTLARAHARSGDPIAIAAYLGGGDSFDRAVTEFAELYADQNERDYEAFVKEIRSGRLEAATESS